MSDALVYACREQLNSGLAIPVQRERHFGCDRPVQAAQVTELQSSILHNCVFTDRWACRWHRTAAKSALHD